MNKEKLKSKLQKKIKRMVSSNPMLHNVQLLIHSESLDIHWSMVADKSRENSIDVEQPFHTASIGKTFTAIIIAKLYEKGEINFDDPIANYLPKDILKDLHVYKGIDYTKDIQVQHLLNNTSGLPDYFDDKPEQGEKFLKLVLEDPTRLWSPEETIQWSKDHLHPRFQPGKKVHYSDTGYNLLGLIIESITSKPYHEVLHEYIFNPLQMKYSYLSHYSMPEAHSHLPPSHIHMGKLQVDIEKYRSFSSFYAGGQTVSTTENLLSFMRALVNHDLIQKETLELMQQWNPMWVGMDYGSGLMRMRFIPFTNRYIGWGHLGASGSSMLYFPNIDTYIIGSFNQMSYQTKSMNFIFFNVVRKLSKLSS